MAARSVRCRAGRSRAPPVSTPSRRPSRSSSARGGSSLIRAAASSIASGSPSSRWQISATAGAFSLVTREVGPDLARPRDEQGHRLVLAELRRRRERSRPRQRQRRHRQLLLAPQPQPGPAGDEDRQAGRGGEQLGDDRGGLEHVLEVVEHQQQPPLPQVVDHGVAQRPLALLPHPQRRRDGRGHEGRVGQRRQVDEPDPVGEGVEQLGRRLQRQARLADAARPGQRQQPGPRAGSVRSRAEQRRRPRQLVSPTEERRRLGREVGQSTVERVERREGGGQAGGDQLGDALRPVEVPEAVLAEVQESHPLRQVVAGQLRRRQREEHLPAVPGVEQAGDAVQRLPEIVAAPRLGLAGVQRHPRPQRPDRAPVLGGQRPLRRHRRGDGLGGDGEGGADLVADRLEDDPAVAGDGLAQQGVVAGEGRAPSRRAAPPSAGCCPRCR